MKNQVLLLIMVLFSFQIFCQSTFTLLISNPTNEYPWDLVELSDHSFLLSSEFYTSSPTQATERFFKITNDGKITHDTIFGNPNGNGVLLTLVYINDTNIFCIGDWANVGENDQKWVARIDTGLKVHWEKKNPTNYTYAMTHSAFLNSQNRIISASSPSNIAPLTNLLFQQYSIDGDLMITSIDSSSDHAILYNLIEFPQNGMYRGGVTGFGHEPWGQVITLDSSLKITGFDSIPHRVNMFNVLKKMCDTSYYISGNIHYNDDFNYSVMLLNENNDCEKIITLGQNDTIDYAANNKSMDFSEPNNLFLGATSNVNLFLGHLGEQNSWFALSNMDSSLNLRWTKYYGGDAYYFLQSIIATQDGGALMVGTRYDYPTQSYQCDIYIIKVDENGAITSTDPVLPPVVHDAIVFPNPGSDHLTVESGPQILGAEFRMMTLEGKQIFSQTLSERRENLVTQFLSPGIYPWLVILHERVVESGKWIKK